MIEDKFKYLEQEIDKIKKSLINLEGEVLKVHNDAKRSGITQGHTKVVNKIKTVLHFLEDSKKELKKSSQAHIDFNKNHPDNESLTQSYNYSKVNYNRFPVKKRELNG